jgi:indolepyruvate ferredoxin oxidoreductase beta subunit
MSGATGEKKIDLLITGVGGQGAILASDIIGKAAVISGIPIRAAETHGMAQRGGSVVNHIRLGTDLGSMIPKKGADIMLALEPMEAVRYLDFLIDGGVIYSNRSQNPCDFYFSIAKYPAGQEILDNLSKKYVVIALMRMTLLMKPKQACKKRGNVGQSPVTCQFRKSSLEVKGTCAAKND